jgi:hypothetical protein
VAKEKAGTLGFTPRGQRLGFGSSLREAHLGEVLPSPSTYIKDPLGPLGSSSISTSSPMWLGSHIWRRAHELEEILQARHRWAAGFPVRVLLSLLCWTGAQTISIHHTGVIPRRCYTCGTRLHRPVRLHDLEVGFGWLHR